MKRNIRVCGALLAASVVALSGCAAGATGTPLASGSGGANGANGAKVELVYWHMEQPPNRVAQFQAVIDQFNNSQPGIHVTQQVQDWNQIYSKIAAAVSSKTQPDLLLTSPDFTAYVRSTGAVQPVTSIVEELDKTHHFIPASTAGYRDKGEYWAVPVYGMVQMLWYRQDLFRKAGITAAPATWDELLAAAAKLTSGNVKGIALPAGKNMATDQVIYSLMITAHAENLFDAQGNVTFNTPDTVRTFDFYKNLLQYSAPDSANYSWGEPQAAFNNGTAAMAIEKGQYLPPFTKESGLPASDLGCAMIPQPTANGQPGSIYYSNGVMVLTTDPAKQAAAKEFLSYVLQPDVYGLWLNAEPGLFLPVTQDGGTAKSWLDLPVISTYKNCVDLMLKQSESGMLFGFTNDQYHSSIGSISSQDLLAQTVQKMYVEKMSASDAVAWGQKQMEAAIK